MSTAKAKDGSTLISLSDIARLLGVSKQFAWRVTRNEKLKNTEPFPKPAQVLVAAQGQRMWRRREVERWIRVNRSRGTVS